MNRPLQLTARAVTVDVSEVEVPRLHGVAIGTGWQSAPKLSAEVAPRAEGCGVGLWLGAASRRSDFLLGVSMRADDGQEVTG